MSSSSEISDTERKQGAESESSFSSVFSDEFSDSFSDSESSDAYNSDSDSENSDSDGSSCDSDDSEHGGKCADKNDDWEVKHAFALKKWGIEQDVDVVKKEKKLKEVKKPSERPAETPGEQSEKVARAEAFEAEVLNMDSDALLATLEECIVTKAKRTIGRSDMLSNISIILARATAANFYEVRIEALRQQISFSLEYASSGVMSSYSWARCVHCVTELIDELYKHPIKSFKIGEAEINSTLVSVIDKLNSSVYRSGVIVDTNCVEARLVLSNLPVMLRLAIIAHCFFLKFDASELILAHSVEIIISSLYYKKDEVASAFIKAACYDMPEFASDFADTIGTPSIWIRKQIESIVSKKIRSQILLLCYCVQNMALNGELAEARMILQLTQLCEMAMSGSIDEKIQYNHAVAQTGLAAFQAGNTALCSALLNDLVGSSKHKELLAQGLSGSKGIEKKAEQEKAERRRLLPFFLHLNLEVLEAVYNLCYMLSEVAYIRADIRTDKQTARCHRFRRMVESFKRNYVPPETSREIIFATANALSEGDIDGAIETIKRLKLWSSMPETTFQLILRKIKEVALSCYLQRFSKLYKSFKISILSEQFLLPKEIIYSAVNRMIVRKELVAAWDAECEFLYINENYSTDLQDNAMQLIVPLTIILENNEATVARSKAY